MSRSYKKTPMYKDVFSDGKKMANRKVRQTNRVHASNYSEENGRHANHEIIKNGGQYKKAFCQYDVIDYKSFYTNADMLKSIESDKKARENGVERRWGRSENELAEIQHWHRTFKRK